ncbi:hypothetical protein Cpir12675_006827 [Ceratocystis pirilliformis]|uniref:Uncharacterized protein n=1 Tax=Ceratocystis pirilliformis TaxID=259994 RepID=A0ABR3YF61_9PEZI
MSTNMTADTTPITPERFSAAITELNQPTLYLKVLEIRNSIAHLVSSNAQLEEFTTGPDADPVCIEAIRENEDVISRMNNRIALIAAEIENRGISWEEFDRISAPDPSLPSGGDSATTAPTSNGVNGTVNADAGTGTGTGANIIAAAHPAWSDGTFQIGTISEDQIHMNHSGAERQSADANSGPLENAEDLQRQLQQRLAELEVENNEDNDSGMHL